MQDTNGRCSRASDDQDFGIEKLHFDASKMFFWIDLYDFDIKLIIQSVIFYKIIIYFLQLQSEPRLDIFEIVMIDDILKSRAGIEWDFFDYLEMQKRLDTNKNFMVKT